jgi:hypothetical protein
MVRNAKKDRDDIDKNKNQIRAIADFLQSLIQLPATPETVAVPPTPNLGDNDDPFVTPKRIIRHVSAVTSFSDIKDEEEEEEGDDDVEGGKAYGDLASPYLKPFLSTRGHSALNHYGIQRAGGNFIIGDSIISVDRDSNLTIKGKHYKGTRGLWELLTRKDVNNKVITESDLKKYKTILEATNAHLEGFEPGNDILIVRGPKFTKVISKLFPKSKRSLHWVTY